MAIIAAVVGFTVAVTLFLLSQGLADAAAWAGLLGLLANVAAVYFTYLTLRRTARDIQFTLDTSLEYRSLTQRQTGQAERVTAYLDVAMKRLASTDILSDPGRAYLPLRCAGAKDASEDALAFVKRTLEGRTRSVLVVGDYGTGKSFLAGRLFLDQADSYLADDTGVKRLPILLSLRRADRLDRESLLALLVEHLHRHGYFGVASPADVELAAVTALLEHGQAVCILDGFDEIKSVAFGADPLERLQELIDSLAFGENRIVVTSRTGVVPGALKRGFAKRFERLALGRMLPWDPRRDWRAYIRMCRRRDVEVADDLEDTVASRPELLELTATPLYCQMLVESGPLLATEQEVNAARLYRLYTRQYFARVNAGDPLQYIGMKDPIAYKEDCLMETAMEMLSHKRIRLSRDEIYHALKLRTDGRYQKELLLEFTTQSVLVYSLLVGDIEDKYSFSHRSFYEFYVAQKVYGQLMAGRTSAVAKKDLLSREILRFVAELTTPKDPFVAAVGRLLATPTPAASDYEERLRRNLALFEWERTGRLADVNLEGMDFTGYDFSHPTRPRKLVNVNLNNAKLVAANLTGVEFSGKRTSLRSAALDDAVLDRVDLRGADLSGATVNGISCVKARFAGAKLGVVGELPARRQILAAVTGEASDHPRGTDEDWYKQVRTDLGD